jgi:hypothetical protein
MMAAYSRPQCGFFDENLEHGGPENDVHLRPNGKPRNPIIYRNRRAAVPDIVYKYNKKKPITGLSQITAGFRIWSERHINECGGQRKEQYISKRMQNWIRNLLYKLYTVCHIFAPDLKLLLKLD